MEVESLRSLVVNPDMLIPIRAWTLPEKLDAWYLIITDNFHWSPSMVSGSAISGDMVAEFQRLADWKNEKGVRAAVVTITDIVSGRYGPFGGGSRDLQEVLRKFLKRARSEWHTYWVLLGGDVSVIPPREVAANVGGYRRKDQSKPDENLSYWDSVTGTLRIHHDGTIQPTTALTSIQTGKIFNRVATPSAADPGWAYTTDDFYAVISPVKTNFVIVRGALADLETSEVIYIIYENTIPTDLYYASLVGPSYGKPGLHDWDLNDNGYYGQYAGTNSIDGVDYLPDLVLGRAPVESASEAQAFVDKVIAYEKYDGLPASFSQKLLLGSSNWGGGPSATPTATNPPEKKRYYAPAGATTAKIRFAGPPDMTETSWKLIAYNGPGDWWEVPYNKAASASSLGYYYATSETYSTVSEFVADIFSHHFEIPIPTSFVVVKGLSSQIHPAMYFWDDVRQDSSAHEKDLVKAQMASELPAFGIEKRLYQDLVDTPGYPAPDLFELSEMVMQAELNTGYNIVSLTGHGWWGGCCGVDYSWVSLLTNGHAGGVVYADSCLTSEFNQNDAVSEIFLKSPSGGAAAYVGNSRYSWIGHGAPLERAFWHRLPLDRHVGRLHNTKGLLADNAPHCWANFALNLMGDPEMPVWVGTPLRFTVTHPSRVVKGNSFIVKVTEAGGSPVVFARICLTGPRDIWELHYTGATGEKEYFTADKQAGDSLTITVTKDDRFPYQGNVLVTSGITIYPRADANLDSKVDISDAITVLGALFLGTGKLPCPDAADANGDQKLDISDPISILSFLFLGGKLGEGDPSCQ